jgi:hypothetical protein
MRRADAFVLASTFLLSCESAAPLPSSTPTPSATAALVPAQKSELRTMFQRVADELESYLRESPRRRPSIDWVAQQATAIRDIQFRVLTARDSDFPAVTSRLLYHEGLHRLSEALDFLSVQGSPLPYEPAEALNRVERARIFWDAAERGDR